MILTIICLLLFFLICLFPEILVIGIIGVTLYLCIKFWWIMLILLVLAMCMQQK